MIRIAVVDDDKYAVNSCNNLLHSFNIPNIDKIDLYDSGEKFLNEIITNKALYDIVILDIDMPDINGFDVARQINELDNGTIIIFYTAHEQYVFKAYEFQPFRYIRKERAFQELPFAMEQAVELLEKRHNKILYFKIDELNQMINTKNIVYFETNGRRCDICLSDGRIINTSKSFNSILDDIKSIDFFVVHKGIAVNLRYVQDYTNQKLVLKNGKQLIISRRNYSDFKSAMINFLRYE